MLQDAIKLEKNKSWRCCFCIDPVDGSKRLDVPVFTYDLCPSSLNQLHYSAGCFLMVPYRLGCRFLGAEILVNKC